MIAASVRATRLRIDAREYRHAGGTFRRTFRFVREGRIGHIGRRRWKRSNDAGSPIGWSSRSSRGWLSVVEDELLPAGATLLLVALLGGAWLIGGGDPGLFGADASTVTGERRGWFSLAGAGVRFALFAALGIMTALLRS